MKTFGGILGGSKGVFLRISVSAFEGVSAGITEINDAWMSGWILPGIPGRTPVEISRDIHAGISYGIHEEIPDEIAGRVLKKFLKIF